MLAVSKETLMKFFPDPYPLSQGFMDASASGYQEILVKYRQ